MNIKMGIDCASPISASGATMLVNSGNIFVGRYMVPKSNSTEWKRLGSNEVKILTNANLLILSVFELSAGRPSGGASVGELDGKSAVNEAKLLKMPRSGCIYFAVDYDAKSSDFGAIEAYLRAAKTQIGRYKIGVYGNYNVIEAMKSRGVCDCYWQTYAWSNGKVSSNANVFQYKNDTQLGGLSVDLDKAFGNEGLWNLNTKESWEEILNSVSTSPIEWKKSIELAINAANNAELGNLEIFKYLGTLIEKVGNLDYNGEKTWTGIIESFSQNPLEWETAINAAVGAANADGNLGELEIFKFLPSLIVKIYNSNK